MPKRKLAHTSEDVRTPRLLITGTPGTGKSSLARRVAEAAGLKYIDVGVLVKEKGLHVGWDSDYQCWILDERKLRREIKPLVMDGGDGNGDAGVGVVVEHHSVGWMRPGWFDKVVCLRADTEPIYDRLVGRGYSGRKLEENVEAEIMMEVLEEARSTFGYDAVEVLVSNTEADLSANVKRLVDWARAFRAGLDEEDIGVAEVAGTSAGAGTGAGAGTSVKRHAVKGKIKSRSKSVKVKVKDKAKRAKGMGKAVAGVAPVKLKHALKKVKKVVKKQKL